MCRFRVLAQDKSTSPVLVLLVAPKDFVGRPRVYVMIRRGTITMTRVFDLAHLGDQPIAVISWINKDGKLTPGTHIKLDPKHLRKAYPAGSFQYDGIADDPVTPGAA